MTTPFLIAYLRENSSGIITYYRKCNDAADLIEDLIEQNNKDSYSNN